MKHGNEDALSFGWILIVAFVVIFAIAWGVVGLVGNSILWGPAGDNTAGINNEITHGRMSEQAAGAAQFNRDYLSYVAVPMFLFGTLVFVVVYAYRVKQGG